MAINNPTRARKNLDRQRKKGSNVFKDLGFPNAGLHRRKADLVYRIEGIIKQHGLKPTVVARLFDIPRADLSKLLRGEFRAHSLQQLKGFLVALQKTVKSS